MNCSLPVATIKHHHILTFFYSLIIDILPCWFMGGCFFFWSVSSAMDANEDRWNGTHFLCDVLQEQR